MTDDSALVGIATFEKHKRVNPENSKDGMNE